MNGESVSESVTEQLTGVNARDAILERQWDIFCENVKEKRWMEIAVRGAAGPNNLH